MFIYTFLYNPDTPTLKSHIKLGVKTINIAYNMEKWKKHQF